MSESNNFRLVEFVRVQSCYDTVIWQFVFALAFIAPKGPRLFGGLDDLGLC